MAELARGRLRRKHDALLPALAGSVRSQQRFRLATQLRHLADLEALITSLGAEIANRLSSTAALIERLPTIPGIGRRTAETVRVEIGTDMARFGSSRRLASWAGMCPGNYESAGTRHGGRTRRGSPWLRSAHVGSAGPPRAPIPTSARNTGAWLPGAAPSAPTSPSAI